MNRRDHHFPPALKRICKFPLNYCTTRSARN
jgi:hypothetical protein